jgi:Ca2+-binding EF-hand superfamily protein
MQEKKELMQTLHASDEWGFLHGKDRVTLESDLLAAFQAADEKGCGRLSRVQLKDSIKQCLGDDVEQKEVSALLGLAKPAEAGGFYFQPIIDSAFRTLKGMHEFAILFED